MKNILPLFFLVSILAACRNASTPPASTNVLPAASGIDSTAEKAAITAAVRGFFKWYGTFMRSNEFHNDDFNYIDDSGPHYKLNAAVLDRYLNEFVKSGFAGQDFVAREKAFFQKCEKYWQNEETGDIPTGMDADHYLCAQEDMTEYYAIAPVRVSFGAPDRATATLSLDGETFQNALNVFVKKENGKWLYVGTECDLGVK